MDKRFTEALKAFARAEVSAGILTSVGATLTALSVNPDIGSKALGFVALYAFTKGTIEAAKAYLATIKAPPASE